MVVGRKSPVTGSLQKKRTLTLKIHRTVTKLIWEIMGYPAISYTLPECAGWLLNHAHWVCSSTNKKFNLKCLRHRILLLLVGSFAWVWREDQTLGLQSRVSVTTGPRLRVVLFVSQVKLHGRDFDSSSNWRETL